MIESIVIMRFNTPDRLLDFFRQTFDNKRPHRIIIVSIEQQQGGFITADKIDLLRCRIIFFPDRMEYLSENTGFFGHLIGLPG